jgi:hypothetical protein
MVRCCLGAVSRGWGEVGRCRRRGTGRSGSSLWQSQVLETRFALQVPWEALVVRRQRAGGRGVVTSAFIGVP